MGYLIGMINPSYLLARLHGIDIRERGSGNAGASNAMLLFGKLRGGLCALFDIAKAAAVVCLARAVFPGDPLVFAVAASACILGHIFPFYMKFRGGKGLACLAGVVMAYDLRVFGILLAFEAVILLATRYICFVPMTGAAVFAFVYFFMNRDPIGTALLLLVAVVVVIRHGENIRRIRRGQEIRISYLWDKETESARMRANYPEDEWDHPEI
jgi:glycerol-3-phosphate acyltransferase PlsY